MTQAALILLSIICSVISVQDFRFHQISNVSNIALLLSLLLVNRGAIFWVDGWLISIISIAMGLFAGLGGGDVKFLMVIGFVGLANSQLIEFCLWLSALSIPISLVYVALKKTVLTQIPLGPAICGALIVTII
jgi:Flp pilus assembly protein protease CpaA